MINSAGKCFSLLWTWLGLWSEPQLQHISQGLVFCSSLYAQSLGECLKRCTRLSTDHAHACRPYQATGNSPMAGEDLKQWPLLFHTVPHQCSHLAYLPLSLHIHIDIQRRRDGYVDSMFTHVYTCVCVCQCVCVCVNDWNSVEYKIHEKAPKFLCQKI